MENKKFLVAVYGSLRKGFGNHRLLENSSFLGEETIEGGYLMYSLYGYPGVVKTEENRKIKIEVYEVDEHTLLRLNMLEGFRGEKNASNFYDREVIKTSFGDTYIYLLNDRNHLSDKYIVENGDWSDYCKNSHKYQYND